MKNIQFSTMKSIVNAAMRGDDAFCGRAAALYNRDLLHNMDVLSLSRREAEERANATSTSEAYDLILADPSLKARFVANQ